jgi:hypothetical protein
MMHRAFYNDKRNKQKSSQARSIYRLISCFVLMLLGFIAPAYAHSPDQSYIFLNIDDQRITGRVELTVKDLNKALSLNWPEDKSVTLEQIESKAKRIDEYINKHLTFSVNAVGSKLTTLEHRQLNVSFAQFVLVDFTLDQNPRSPEKITITNNLLFDTDPKHRSLLVVENNWKTATYDNEMLVSLSFSPADKQQTLDLANGSALQGLWGIIKLGMHHIWIGADHVLFLIALLIPSVMQRRKNHWESVGSLRGAVLGIVKIVTVFTLAHSVTLSLATLNLLSLESRFVESVIAFSIGAAALHILWPKITSHALWLVLVFGLFHGLGFASVLSEMSIPDSFIFWSLFGFNVGVEMGQLAIVVIIVPLLYGLSKNYLYQKAIMPLAAIGLIAISLYWFIERAFGFDFRLGSSLRALFGF